MCVKQYVKKKKKKTYSANELQCSLDSMSKGK